MDKKELKTNSTDIITSWVSAVVGMIPVVGGVVSELVQNLIPNQRQDRIVKFIESLSNELDKIKFDIAELRQKFENVKYGTFTYDCLKSVVNNVYDEKIEYYKKLCLNAITEDEKNLIHCERILKILEQLDYYEILYLIFYEKCNTIGPSEMRQSLYDKLGFDILQPSYYIGMQIEQRDEETYKQITLNNLCNTGLLDMEVKYNSSGRNPRTTYKITTLGRLVLRKIGELEWIN